MIFWGVGFCSGVGSFGLYGFRVHRGWVPFTGFL